MSFKDTLVLSSLFLYFMAVFLCSVCPWSLASPQTQKQFEKTMNWNLDAMNKSLVLFDTFSHNNGKLTNILPPYSKEPVFEGWRHGSAVKSTGQSYKTLLCVGFLSLFFFLMCIGVLLAYMTGYPWHLWWSEKAKIQHQIPWNWSYTVISWHADAGNCTWVL